jgi:rhamnosyltransferase
MNLSSPKISIIIRIYNEEYWIAHCLGVIFTQDFDNFEVIIVDNNSSDHSVEVAKRFPIAKVINIDKFIPGKAINEGIRASSGDYIACISCHCIPKDNQWLKNLYENLKDNHKIAGVYGRQIPLSYTSDADKRDLLITFGKDKKVQVNDYFFHNANSMFPRDIWDKFPFDEDASNIEDRIWGKEVIAAGYEIVYEPKAQVYHYHGLHHHGNSSNRAKGIATILDRLDEESMRDLPDSLKPKNICVAAIFLVNTKIIENSLEFMLLSDSVRDLKQSIYINEIYIASFDEKIAISNGAKWIDRNHAVFDCDNVNVEKLLSLSLEVIESRGSFPGVVLYVNHHYPFRPKNLYDDLVNELQYMGLSSVFPCFVDYGHYWQKDKKGVFLQIDSSLDSRDKREPFMRALYGLGCATTSVEIRKGNITGDNVGILPIENYQFTLNAREKGSQEIIRKITGYE